MWKKLTAVLMTLCLLLAGEALAETKEENTVFTRQMIENALVSVRVVLSRVFSHFPSTRRC